MKPLRIGIASLLAIVFVMWLLKPSYSDFKLYSARQETYFSDPNYPDEAEKMTIVRKKIADYFIYSVYQLGYSTADGKYHPTEQYKGILLNFYKM